MRVALILAAVIVLAVPTPAGWVEALYSQRLYLIVQNALTPLSSLIQVALFDLLVAASVLGVCGWVFLTFRRWRSEDHWRVMRRLAVSTLTLLAGVYLVFVFVWGLNYRRAPLTSKIEFRQDRVTRQALAETGRTAVVQLNALHAGAHAGRWPEFAEMPGHLGASFAIVQARLGVSRAAVPGVPKPTLLTPYFRHAGVDGMINPFSLEVLVNTDVLPFERPFVVAHEWAHLAGYADESEANFVGWLTCVLGDAQSRYSAWIFLAPHLFRHLEPDEQSRMWESLDDGPTRDFRTVSERLSRATPVVRRHARRVYDQYLRANRVGSGIHSYGLVVDLVLGSELGGSALVGR